MRVTLDYTLSEETACLFGEFLRGQFFDQRDGGHGCYSTFVLYPEVETLPSLEVDGIEWQRRFKIVRGYRVSMAWCRDGTLEFNVENEHVLTNGDCKKSHHWVLEPYNPSAHAHLEIR